MRDIRNQTSHGRELAAGILQQAMAGLWRFRKSKDKAGREVYSDAVSWFLSNDTQWPCSFRNVCRFLGPSPEEVRERVFTDAHPGWVAHSETFKASLCQEFSFSEWLGTHQRNSSWNI